ncbi:MAG: type II toxin-antitoxin system PrlF family antitoxin [Polyangia bacterium]
MAAATITSKGQITIPKSIRKMLRLEAGDRIGFVVREDGVVEMKPETLDIRELRGCLDPRRHGVSLEEMEKDIAAEATDR